MNIKIINAGNYKLLTGFCIICGRKIKIVTKAENNKYSDILFCSRCEEHRASKDKIKSESEK
jgi:ribosome-binding protein aMBF1 (putative translation factor)